MTPREVTLILRGEVARLKVDNDLARHRNFELARLTAFAYHDPKNIPDFSDGTKQKAEVPDEVAQAQVRAFFIARATKSKSG